jgi:hypothetical protein
MFVVGCGETKIYPKLDTVQKAWDEMIDASKARDGERLYNMLPQSSKDEGKSMGMSEDEMKAGLAEALDYVLESVDFDFDAFKVTNIREEGDVAYVEFVVEGYPDWPSTEYKFIKENGEWKYSK